MHMLDFMAMTFRNQHRHLSQKCKIQCLILKFVFHKKGIVLMSLYSETTTMMISRALQKLRFLLHISIKTPREAETLTPCCIAQRHNMTHTHTWANSKLAAIFERYLFLHLKMYANKNANNHHKCFLWYSSWNIFRSEVQY